MGAWIETQTHLLKHLTVLSLPIWERGLKHSVAGYYAPPLCVAPYMGAWIETFSVKLILTVTVCRSLYGSVD